MTETGQVCLTRATLECERRFFGNKTEELFDELDDTIQKKIELSDREKGVLCLDARTVLDVSIMTTRQWESASSI